MTESARLLIPAIRWDHTAGFAGSQQRLRIEEALALGCGGYIIFGGEIAAVRELTSELRERSGFPLLIASDLERGAGQQFAGATGLPPLAAIGDSGEVGAASRAARLTAREALACGVNWVLAPVADIDIERSNPIVGTRSFGAAPAEVTLLVSEWVDACQATGALACAKHFPGHGRTTVDSHAALPVVRASGDELRATDLLPFRAAIEAGVGSILTAHVAFPALDASAAPATLSRPILHDLLRREMKYDGIVVTDAMIMEGVLAGMGEEGACVAALAAGCDLVLYPENVSGVAAAVERAIATGGLEVGQVKLSLERRERWAAWTAQAAQPSHDHERDWAREFALRCVREIRGSVRGISTRLDLILIDDDVGGPWPPPSREPFREALQRSGFDVRWVEAPALDGDRMAVVALFGDIRSWKGRAGYGQSSLAAVTRAVDREPECIVMQFSHPRLVDQLPSTASQVVSAWGGERVMQEAAAGWLSSRMVARE